MRRDLRRMARALGLPCALLLLAPAPTRCAPADAGRPSAPADTISESTWVDHDRQSIRQPQDWAQSYWGRRVHQGLVEPIGHMFDIPDLVLWTAGVLGAQPRREAVNVNAFDEVPNSSWFTNRNHRRSVPVAELCQGPDSVSLPAKPWIIKHAKQGGWSTGFQIKDASGKRWLVKLDPRGYPQLSSGADIVARTLLHAAGFNVPHNEPVRFHRGDLTIDADLLRGADGERFTDVDLDSLLARGALFPDGSQAASASLFIAGHALGSPSMNRLRPGDPNDRYTHTHRRELRGLFVLCSWIGDWDTEDHQFLDSFVEVRDSLGHVEHYILDVGSSFGAAASGPKMLSMGYENALDFGWTARRFVTLGFVDEPWRRARQETGIASVGNYGSADYRPQDFREFVPQPAFREMTDRDGYWGAKIVASFSDAQVAAAVDAAHYDDPQARACLVRNLIVRRDKIAQYWFGRVAPLDFFSVQDGALRFHDLAVDIGLARTRAYDVAVGSVDGRAPRRRNVHLTGAELPLAELGNGASRLSLEVRVAGDRAKPVRLELTRVNSVWTVTRVQHG